MKNRAGALRHGADEEARQIDEICDGYVERVAQVNEAGHFLGRRRVETAAALAGIVGHDTDRFAFEKRETGHERTALKPAHLEERPAVHDEFDEPANVVRLASPARHDLQEFLLPAIGGIVAAVNGRLLPHVRRQIAQERPDDLEGVLLAVGNVVDEARDFAVNVRSAEFLLGDLFVDAAFDHGGPGDEDLARVLDHHPKVTGRDPHGAEPGHRAHRRADDRNRGQQFHAGLQPGNRGNVGSTHLLQRLDAAAAARTVYQSHERKLEFQGHLLRVAHLVADRAVLRAAAYRKVVAGYDDLSILDAAAAEHEIGRPEFFEFAGLVVFSATGQSAGFVKRTAVHQRVDPFSHAQLAVVVLPTDRLLATHAPRERFAPAQFLDLVLPTHACLMEICLCPG